ncbi:MAG: hypothetical protein K2X39_02945, partial [Silvanigrellaceae bacterium]|nr:hypothetical protein [Silvanigrellaceae bacterium]
MSPNSKKMTFDSYDAKLPTNNIFYKLPVASLTLGMVSFLIAVLFMKGREEEFYLSFHVSWLFFLSIALGGMFFVLIQFLTKAGWSVLLRRFGENIAGTMPLLFILMVLMFAGSHTLFHHWVHPEANDTLLQSKQWYLNLPFFYGRSLLYFSIWLFTCYYLRKKSLEQDITGSHENTYQLQTMSIPLVILSGLAVTFAS